MLNINQIYVVKNRPLSTDQTLPMNPFMPLVPFAPLSLVLSKQNIDLHLPLSSRYCTHNISKFAYKLSIIYIMYVYDSLFHNANHIPTVPVLCVCDAGLVFAETKCQINIILFVLKWLCATRIYIWIETEPASQPYNDWETDTSESENVFESVFHKRVSVGIKQNIILDMHLLARYHSVYLC